MPLNLFTALVAEGRLRDVFTTTFAAEFLLGLLVRSMAAAGAELRVGSQVFRAIGTLVKDQELVTA